MACKDCTYWNKYGEEVVGFCDKLNDAIKPNWQAIEEPSPLEESIRYDTGENFSCILEETV